MATVNPSGTLDRSYQSSGGDFSTANAPGNGSGFFAGVDELFANPKAFFQDINPFGSAPANTPPPPPGGGFATLAGTEELFTEPGAFVSDAGSVATDAAKSVGSLLPSSPTTIIILALAAIGILGAAYIAHKAL